MEDPGSINLDRSLTGNKRDWANFITIMKMTDTFTQEFFFVAGSIQKSPQNHSTPLFTPSSSFCNVVGDRNVRVVTGTGGEGNREGGFIRHSSSVGMNNVLNPSRCLATVKL